MKTEPDGGSAFPTTSEVKIEDHIFFVPSGGMSLRDWFAGMALQGMLSANAKMHEDVTGMGVDAVIAREAYLSADAMIAERIK